MSKARGLADLGNVYDDGALSNRNMVVNGAMTIDQRNNGSAVTVNTGNAFYCLDRYFGAGTNSAGVFTIQQSSTAPAGFNSSSLITVTTSATPSGTDNYRFNQAVEGLNVAHLNWGSANAQSVTLSFWVRSSLTGTFGGALQNSSKSRTYPFSYTISAANTWEKQSITISGDTTGTWLTSNGIGVLAVWCLGAADRLGPANAWSSTRYDGATGQVNLIGTNGATFYITGVQLEVGDTATPFEHRSYGDELARCQRYFWKMGNTGTTTNLMMAAQETTSSGATSATLPVTMRAVPSVTLGSDIKWYTAATGGVSVTAFSNRSSSDVGSIFCNGIGSSGVAGQAGTLYDAGNDGYILWDAEL